MNAPRPPLRSVPSETSDYEPSEVVVTQPEPRQPYRIPGNERYFLDADGYCWREVSGLPVTDLMPDGIAHSMARVNPDNSPTPQPLVYLTPVTEEHHTLRAYRLALLDAAVIFRQTADDYEPHTIGRQTHDEAARVLRRWAEDPGRMVGPLHRLRANDLAASCSRGRLVPCPVHGREGCSERGAS